MGADEALPAAVPETMSLGERALAESSERYSSLFIYHPHATYSVDRDGYYTDANPVSLAMTGLSLERMREIHFSEVIHPEDVQAIQSGFELALDGDPQVVEARVLHTDGLVIDIRCTMIPVVIGERVVGVHGVSEDITEANQVVRRLEQASAAKSLFLSNVSHEVRTPLASVIAAAELLQHGELELDQRRCVDIVHRNGQRLQRLMNDILDFSKLEANQVLLRLQPFAVSSVVEGVADWALPFAENRDLGISFTVDDSVPCSVVGDGLRVSQVLNNLVHNALKFTEQGGVEVRVTSTTGPGPGDSPRGPVVWVEFAVEDTGVGIAEADVDALFEPFTQADASTARRYDGVGLGLAICRDLADLMGGRLHTVSTLGQGSTFTFAVPLACPGGPDA